ncbi:glycosyltransferase family 2 protein [Glycomyces tarimensis]
MSGGRVTVAVITRDRRTELERTLSHMTGLPDAAPVIVVDNASSDGTASAVRTKFPQVELVRSERNLGAIGRNIAVGLARTPYVAFCDDDTRWEPGSLTRAAELLDAHPSVASITGRCLVEPGLEEDPITPELRESPVPGPAWLPGRPLMGVLAGITMFRVEAFEQVGGFDRRMWFSGEEELLALDLAAAGWWMCWAEDVVVRHHPSRQRDSSGRRRLGIRNTLWTQWLRRPARSAMRRSLEVLRSSPADAVTAGAVLDAVRGAPWVLRRRRVLPPSLEASLLLLEGPQRASKARRYI